jgi:hypothetical protein
MSHNSSKEFYLASELELDGYRIKSVPDLFEYVLSKYQVNKEKYLTTLNISKWESELMKHSIASVADLLKYYDLLIFVLFCVANLEVQNQ